MHQKVDHQADMEQQYQKASTPLQSTRMSRSLHDRESNVVEKEFVRAKLLEPHPQALPICESSCSGIRPHCRPHPDGLMLTGMKIKTWRNVTLYAPNDWRCLPMNILT